MPKPFQKRLSKFLILYTTIASIFHPPISTELQLNLINNDMHYCIHCPYLTMITFHGSRN